MLRHTESGDLPAIYRMLCELEGMELPMEPFREVFLRNIASTDNHYMVAMNEDGDVVGHIAVHTQWLLHHAGRVAEIQEMYVAPGLRGLGIGDALLRDGIEWAKRKNCVLIEVTANGKRERTFGFYQRGGFIHTHRKFTMPLP